MSMIYSLVSREQVVLVDYSAFSGNFSQVALEVLHLSIRFLEKPIYQKLLDSLPLPTTAFTPMLKIDTYLWPWSNPM